MSVSDYSTTPASNTTINGIGIAGTNLASNFDNAFRQIMADIASGIVAGSFTANGYVAKSANYTVTTSDRGKVIDCTAALELDLPEAATAGAGFVFIVKANGGDVTIDPNGTENIDGASTSKVVSDGTSVLILCTGTAWHSVLEALGPTETSSFVTLTGTQTLTNKTLTSPTINSPTVTGLDASTTAKGLIEIATDAEYRTGTNATNALTPDTVYDAAAVVTLTDAATIAVDMSSFINAQVTLAGNRTLGNPTNAKVGQSGMIAVTVTGGPRTLNKASNWVSTTSFPINITTGTAAYLFYHVYTTSLVVVSVINGPS